MRCLLADRRIRLPIAVALAIWVSAALWIALSILLGTDVIAILMVSGLYPIGLAATITGLAIRVRHQFPQGSSVRQVWGVLVVAFAFWTLGEILWLAQGLAERLTEVPGLGTPDDLFYISGGVLISLFFALHLRLIWASLSLWKKILTIGVSSLIFITLVVLFIVLPLFSRPPHSWLEILAAAAYSISYVLILTGATAWAAAMAGGRMNRSWLSFTAGMWLHALYMLAFTASATKGLYYPEGQINLSSIAHDLLYLLAYLLVALGLYWRVEPPSIEAMDERVEEEIASTSRFRFGEIGLVLSDDTGRIFFVSPRLLAPLGLSETGSLVGEFVGKALGLNPKVESRLLEQVRRYGTSEIVSFQLAGRTWGIRAVGEQDAISAPEIYWILAPWEARVLLLSSRPDQIDAMMAQTMRGAAGITAPELNAMAYVWAFFRALSALCFHFGGPEVAREFVRRFEPGLRACEEALQTAAPLSPCRSWMAQMREFAAAVVPPQALQEIAGRIKARLGEETVRDAERFGLLQ